MADEESLTDREMGELAALADGSLPERRRAAVEARVAESATLQALVDEQRRAAAAVRGVDVAAPDGLRSRVAADRRRAAPRARRRRLGLAAGLATAVAVGALALVLTLPGSLPGGPTVVQAAQLTIRPPTAPGPPQSSRRRTVLDAATGGVPYPYWSDDFGWRAVGKRTDRLDGRRVTTVFYARGPRRLGYAIVPGPRLRRPADALQRSVRGTRFRLVSVGGRRVVTWERGGHTCVISAAGVGDGDLLRLAAWRV